MTTFVQYYGTGRRKTSVARVYLRPGSGQVIINKQPLEQYFGREVLRKIALQPLELTRRRFGIGPTIDPSCQDRSCCCPRLARGDQPPGKDRSASQMTGGPRRVHHAGQRRPLDHGLRRARHPRRHLMAGEPHQQVLWRQAEHRIVRHLGP